MIGNKPSTYRSPICVYCGSATDDSSLRAGYAVVVCDLCDLGNLFSDLWKDEFGSRPRFYCPTATKRAYVRQRTVQR